MTAPTVPVPAPAPQQTEPVRPGPTTPQTPNLFSPTRNSVAEQQINDTSDAEFAELMGLGDLVKPKDAAPPVEPVPVVPPAAPEQEQALPDTPVTDGPPRNADGTFAPKAGETAAPAAEAAVEPPPAAAPEPEKPPVKLATEFSLADAEGPLDVADAATRLKVTFKADGKEHKDVPLDRVVRLAQMGVYNEARQQEVANGRAEVARIQQEMQAREQTAQEYDQWFRRVMEGDDTFLQNARAEWAARNSPEERARRAEQQMQQMQYQQQQQTEMAQAAHYVNTEMVPLVVKAVEGHPTVTFDEAYGRFNSLVLPYLVQGRVPLNRLPEVKRVVEAELVPWIESTHQQRDGSAKQQTQQAERQQQAARTQATLAKRQLARAVAPSPAAPPPLRETPKPKTFKSAQQATDEFDPSVPLPGEV